MYSCSCTSYIVHDNVYCLEILGLEVLGLCHAAIRFWHILSDIDIGEERKNILISYHVFQPKTLASD